MADFDPVLQEIKVGNALTRELLAEKREDDTPKSLFMGNMFEIFNANKLQNINEKFQTSHEMHLVDDEIRHTHEMLGKLTEGFNGLQGFVKQSVETTREVVKKTGKNTTSFFSKMSNNLHKFFSGGKAREKEEKKDRQSFLARLIGSVGGALGAPFKFLGKTIKSLNDSLLGKVGFATIITALASFLIAKFPTLADAVGQVIKAFYNLIIDTEKLFSGEMGFGEFLTQNFLTFIGLGLAAFGKSILVFFGTTLVAYLKGAALAVMLAAGGGLKAALTTALGSISILLLKFVALPYAFIKGIIGFFKGYSQRLEEGGGFFTSLIAGLQGFIGGFIGGVGDVLNYIVEFFLPKAVEKYYHKYIADPIKAMFQWAKDFFTIDFDAVGESISNWWSGDGDKKTEGRYMGGPVSAGNPYIVGERGPELFVPGGSGSIIPNGGGMAGGGAPIIVTNNNVVAPTNTHSHQHSNVSITDSQAENTGL